MAKMKADHATPTTTGPMDTPEEMVSTGASTSEGVNDSPAAPGAPDVMLALGLWTKENDNLDANNKKKASLLLKLEQAEADEVTLVRRWGLRRQAFLSAVNVFCDGSKEKVQAFNLTVAERKKAPQATTPQGLHQAPSPTPTTAKVAWKLTPGADGYMVQHAADPNDPATYASPVMCTRVKFSVPGLALGSTLSFRVLALDPSLPGGQTAYCTWVTVTVGA